MVTAVIRYKQIGLQIHYVLPLFLPSVRPFPLIFFSVQPTRDDQSLHRPKAKKEKKTGKEKRTNTHTHLTHALSLLYHRFAPQMYLRFGLTRLV